ncbi:MAG: hypothetical protein JRI61_00710 [Deltaproteobacteria bacterium]|nr:hypothetical protein [Deltaproteobacteria bacterium]
MKHLSLKIIILCIIFPPVFHLGALQSLEKYLTNAYKTEIENVYTGDTRMLFDGNIRLKDAVNNNIDNYLQNRALVSWGVKPNVMVTTKKGAIIYPSFEEEDSLLPPTRKQIANENYKLLSEGIKVQVDVSLERSSFLVISIFSFFLLISILILSYYYRAGVMKAKMEYFHKEEEINRLLELEKKGRERMSELDSDKAFLSTEFKRIKTLLEDSRIKTRRDEDDMIDEIIALEKKIDRIHSLYDGQQDENLALKEIISKYEKGELKTGKQKEKASKHLSKRFRAVYKDILFHQKAIYGFTDLTDEMRIKAEEIIRQMDENSALVKIKRKVMTKKNPEAVFEVTFSHSGRIYFSKEQGGKTKILAIGTKNTQDKDLSFLNTL